jgi:hypothetical protein
MVNSEETNQYLREYRLKNKDKINQKQRDRYKNNPDYYRDKNYQNWPLTLIRNAKTSTKLRISRGREMEPVSIDKEWLLAKLEEQKGLCYWFNIEMSIPIGVRNPANISLDRLDPTKGYTPENTVLSCAGANFMRSNLNEQETRLFINSILEANS